MNADWMNRRCTCLLLAAAVATTAPGCLGRSAPQAYLLEFPAETAGSRDVASASGKNLLVEEFAALSEYSRQSFAFRSSPHRIQYDPLRRWAVPPEVMLQERVAQYCQATGLFSRVATRLGMPAPDLTLRGTILRLGERTDDPQGRIAELRLHLELLDARTQTLLWSATKNREKKVDGRSFESAIEALSTSLREILQESLPEMQARWKAP
ncbi:MAG: membrane integrity-associated transporter subunit PqiC [Planctomycetes bacterium]|nr:membrane integrity-associated transporter subunit PqiC [Planctomycetota bacterium]